MISNGIEYFSDEHALVIAGTIQFCFDNVNPAAAELEAAMIEAALNPKPKHLTKDKHRTLLKQKLYLSKNTYYGYGEDDDGDSEEDEDAGLSETQQRNWTDYIIIGLSAHAVLARRRVEELQDRLRKTTSRHEHGAIVLLLRQSIDSFHNCARSLVYIGETALRRLPNNPRVVGFCSRLVLCLAQLFIEPNIDIYDYDKMDYRTYARTSGRSLIDPNRYADSILNATKNYRQRHFQASLTLEVCDEAVKEAIDKAGRFLRAPPDRDIQDLIWCLFTKDFVDPMASRCGYGDIKVWWGLPVTPLDPLLFFDNCNTPDDQVIENSWDLNTEVPIPWETDEVRILYELAFTILSRISLNEQSCPTHIKDGGELWGDRLDARYDFSLVLLLCAWSAPWSIESHHSFQRPFREAVKALFLCANRIRMPTDIVSQVCAFMRRDWWPDERTQCFSEECLEKRATKLLHQKLIHGVSASSSKSKRPGTVRAHKPCTSCSGCHVASYCCEEHKQSDYRDGHKSLCGKPPYQVPGRMEQELFKDVLCLEESESTSPVLNEKVRRLVKPRPYSLINEGDDDSGSWESVDTENDEEQEGTESLTDVVYRFFERECYRFQRNDDET